MKLCTHFSQYGKRFKINPESVKVLATPQDFFDEFKVKITQEEVFLCTFPLRRQLLIPRSAFEELLYMWATALWRQSW